MGVIRAGDYIPTGWFHDGEQPIWHDGRGTFYVAGTYYYRPDLLVGQPPPPPSMAEKVQMAMQQLSTPWPTYGEAWRAAKAGRWISRYYVMGGWLVALLGALHAVRGTAETYGDFYGPFFTAMLWLATWPFSIWWLYYKHLRQVAPKKARAFLWASYLATAAGAHAAANRPMPPSLGVPDGRGHWLIPPGSPDSYRPRR